MTGLQKALPNCKVEMKQQKVKISYNNFSQVPTRPAVEIYIYMVAFFNQGLQT